ncbi:MAG: HEAT repeat domain-containing protein [Nitrospiraceae bacterium]|nr:MAG: HEAT repeat domain-containing protein [Nitrospiraceae bacterium]
MDNKQDTESTIRMIADYMEKGFLENIVDMFKHSPEYYPYIGTMLADERMGVRIGTFALVETLAELENNNLPVSIPGIASLLQDPNVTIRGDAAHMLGIIGHKDALPYLVNALHDDHEMVREHVSEAIEEIKNSR